MDGRRQHMPDAMLKEESSVIDKDSGRARRAAAWSTTTAKKVGERATRSRESHASIDVGFRAAERQRRVAAMVLAGGIAYRIFFWLLAISVIVSGLLGLFAPNAVQTTLEHQGMRGWAAGALAQLSRSADGSSWWLLLTGGWLLLWTGYTCSKALVLAHATIWGVAPPRVESRSEPRSSSTATRLASSLR